MSGWLRPRKPQPGLRNGCRGLGNLAALGKLPCKSLEAGILEPEKLVETIKHMSSQPSSALVEQADAALRNVIYVSDRSGSVKRGYVKALRDAARCVKAIAITLGDRAKQTREGTPSLEDQREIRRLESSNAELRNRCCNHLWKTRLQR